MEFKTPTKITKKKITIPSSPFLKKIGFGTGIAVYEFQRSPSSYKINSPWAIKKTLKSANNKAFNSRILKEAEVLKKLNHPNIVGFRAFLKSEKGQNILAMEECTYCLGNLIEDKRENGEEIYSYSKVVKVGEDISKALNYLHSSVFILHCDIKSFNILIKNDFEVVKLCDFGTCLPLTKEGFVDTSKVGSNIQYNGTYFWEPPEVSELEPIITSKADIYSFGLVFYEMITLRIPFSDQIDLDQSDSSLDKDTSYESIPDRELMFPDDLELSDQYNVILEIIGSCTIRNYKNRPSSSDLQKVFEMLAKQIN